MATLKVQDTDIAIVRALVKQYNALHDATVGAAVDGYFHADVSSLNTFGTPVALSVTAANATDLASSLALTNNILAVYSVHIADDSAHLIKDTVNVSAYALGAAVDLASALLALNDLKAKYNLHRVASGVHVNNDSTNTVSAANATDQSSANTLANAIKTALNAHVASGPAVGKIKVLT